MIAHALRYASLGWRIFPLFEPVGPGVCSCSKGATCGRNTGKHPRVADWPRVATSEKATIRSWWRSWSRASIAIATGRGLLPSSTLTALRARRRGSNSLRVADFPRHPRRSTGRGRHLISLSKGEQRARARARLVEHRHARRGRLHRRRAEYPRRG